MSRATLASLAALLAVAAVRAQGLDAPSSTYPATPLASKHFAYPSGIPYQADEDNLLRGTQFGYNRCNATTEGQDSLCQTAFLSSLDDFCLWAPSKPNSAIADTEGEEVAWCTKPGRGTRLIPAGALRGVQFMRTPDYVQVVGFLDQAALNIAPGDAGGELDPHGADLRGNPLGGLVYSTAFGPDNSSYTQVNEWTNFMGGDAFCFKACDPAGPNAARFCEHVYDRLGCAVNMPNRAATGTFEACAGDSQDFPGVYTGADGGVSTYKQPPASAGPIPALGWAPRVPASSGCVARASAEVYAALAGVTAAAGAGASTNAASTSAAGAGAGATTSAGVAGAGSTGAGATASRSAAAAAASRTGTTSGAEALAISGAGVLGVVFAALFLS